MTRVFFIVGPTAVGKSEIAADVAHRLGAEVLSADAFQIYRGLDLLTAKPNRETLAKAPHHLIGAVPLSDEMNAAKFRDAAEPILGGGKPVIVVGGTGLYIKALTHGLAPLPAANPQLRDKLERTTTEELLRSLRALDPVAANKVDSQNRRRLIRAVEVCLLTGQPFSAQRTEWNRSPGILPVGRIGVSPVPWSGQDAHSPHRQDACATANGVLLERDRAELYARIDQRVKEMFASGVVEEVGHAKNIGATAAQTLGLRQIRALIAGEISEAECVAQIQQATRRYAKRQLTWFRRQTNFPSLNLSAHDPADSVELISQSASRVFARG
ncbi:MAG TPA: tRNA (adenosine(37)-N6)-dimethylallyltransferase MiaA [Chthoniobacterales bacterium]|nr:tRNA (adenosine(37)-N6)-dimethylallyltransferase MiaA [Chthoniobacterales bacterium]